LHINPSVIIYRQNPPFYKLIAANFDINVQKSSQRRAVFQDRARQLMKNHRAVESPTRLFKKRWVFPKDRKLQSRSECMGTLCCSMCGAGRCYGNGRIEHCFSTLLQNVYHIIFSLHFPKSLAIILNVCNFIQLFFLLRSPHKDSLSLGVQVI
jgi:hypothetical protein